MGSIQNRGQSYNSTRLNQTFGSRIASSNKGNDAIKYARVLYVVEKESDPYWEQLGGSLALYGVFYQELFVGQSDTLEPARNFAYCKQEALKRLPVKNEIVVLTKAINAALTEKVGTIVESVYWDSVVPVWNSPHLNAYPDTKAYKGKADTGEFFVEKDIFPIQLCPGDVILEGRHGQSIRMGGTYYTEGSLSSKESNGNPYTIIRNGQSVESQYKDRAGVYSVSENIDKDASSVYLTVDQPVPLTQASTKRSAWKEGPVEAKDFKDGSQVLLNADRVFINGRNKDIELSAKESIGLNATTNVSVDAKDYVSFDANKVYLGSAALKEKEPVLKGTETTDWLNKLCDQLSSLVSKLATPVGSPAAWAAVISAYANSLLPQIKQIKQEISKLPSNKVYTE